MLVNINGKYKQKHDIIFVTHPLSSSSSSNLSQPAHLRSYKYLYEACDQPAEWLANIQ